MYGLILLQQRVGLIHLLELKELRPGHGRKECQALAPVGG